MQRVVESISTRGVFESRTFTRCPRRLGMDREPPVRLRLGTTAGHGGWEWTANGLLALCSEGFKVDCQCASLTRVGSHPSTSQNPFTIPIYLCSVSTESPRQQKFARLLQKELAELFQRDVPHLLPPGGMVSVQTVRVSPDLSQARVYLSTLLAPDPAALLAVITENKPLIRKHLGWRIGKQARVVPDLHFLLDDTGAYAARIEGLLNSLDIKPEEESKA